MIQYSGNLLVKVRNRPFAGLLAGPQPLTIPGYRLEPLFKAHHAGPMFSAAQPADHWLTATASAGRDRHESGGAARGRSLWTHRGSVLVRRSRRKPKQGSAG